MSAYRERMAQRLDDLYAERRRLERRVAEARAELQDQSAALEALDDEIDALQERLDEPDEHKHTCPCGSVEVCKDGSCGVLPGEAGAPRLCSTCAAEAERSPRRACAACGHEHGGRCVAKVGCEDTATLCGCPVPSTSEECREAMRHLQRTEKACPAS